MKELTPLRAIKLYCLECSGGSIKERRLCPIKDCPLYPYRFGHNPKRKGLGQKNPKFLKTLDTEGG